MLLRLTAVALAAGASLIAAAPPASAVEVCVSYSLREVDGFNGIVCVGNERGSLPIYSRCGGYTIDCASIG